MTLCVNESGTWRKISTQCVNQSGTWRKVVTGCINQSGTWRCYGFLNLQTCLGCCYEGGYLICAAAGVAWIVAPSSTQVIRTWYNRNDAVTTANSNAACGDWFVPTCGQLFNPGYTCRTYWDSYTANWYWSSTERSSDNAWILDFANGTFVGASADKSVGYRVRAFRCITY